MGRNKKTGIALIVFVIAVVIHNLGSALISLILGTEFEEAVFFIIAVIIIPLYFIVSIVYSIIKKLKRRKNE